MEDFSWLTSVEFWFVTGQYALAGFCAAVTAWHTAKGVWGGGVWLASRFRSQPSPLCCAVLDHLGQYAPTVKGRDVCAGRVWARLDKHDDLDLLRIGDESCLDDLSKADRRLVTRRVRQIWGAWAHAFDQEQKERERQKALKERADREAHKAMLLEHLDGLVRLGVKNGKVPENG